MKKLFAAILFALCAFPAFATTPLYYCSCDAGAASGCTAGIDTNSGATMALARKTFSKMTADAAAGAAGDQFKMCQGGSWSGVSVSNFKNTNSTKSNPIVIDSYDASSVWSGGAGIQPLLTNTGTAAIFGLSRFIVTHSEGYIIRNLDLEGGGTNTQAAILGIADNDYVTITGMTINGFMLGIQCNGAANASSATSDGISTNWTIVGNTITNIREDGILTGCGSSLIQGNTFTNVGSTVFYHGIYMTGAAAPMFPQTISSITGTGTTATLTTAAPHGIPTGSHFIITVTGASDVGYNVTNAVGTVTGASTLTYSATGTGSGAGATYTATREVPQSDFVVRNNTFTDNNNLGAGHCVEAVIVAHGAITGLLIEGNTINETVVNTSTTCVGIEVDDGGYAPPEDYNRFFNVVIRGNTTINTAQGIGADLISSGLIENNWHYSTYSTNSVAGGIRMRSKNTVPSNASYVKPTNGLNPNNVTIRYNTEYLANPNSGGTAGHYGIALNGNVADPLTGAHFNMYGNVVVLGASATATTECYDTQNVPASKFDVKDYNACIYLGSTLPDWDFGKSLATTQGDGSEAHSTMTSSASVTTDQPFFTAPTTGPNIGASSALIAAGHPTLGPLSGWGGSHRHAAPWDIGAFSFGDTLAVVPNSPTPP